VRQVAVLLQPVRAAAATLFPGYFALTMATGALSIASHLLGQSAVAVALLAVNVAAFTSLWSLTLLRLVCFPRPMLADLMEHARGPGFFTLVAGTAVFGTQLVVVGGAAAAARVCLVAAMGLWVVVMYAFFTAVIVRSRKPNLESGINGAWLIAAVATQSVSVLGSNIAPGMAEAEGLLFLCLCMYLLGCMLYLSIITLIFYRLTFVRLTSSSLSPPYWINMGAVAITTLSGSLLIMRAGQSALLRELLPFLKGFTLFFWTAASWWIPLLLILMVWRHLVRRHPLAYEPQFWGMVFPLAMYTTGTLQISHALGLPFLEVIPQCFIWLAAAMWTVTMIGMLRSIARQWRDALEGSRCP
jgi:tellurite resistance protein TehA-like permease